MSKVNLWICWLKDDPQRSTARGVGRWSATAGNAWSLAQVAERGHYGIVTMNGNNTILRWRGRKGRMSEE